MKKLVSARAGALACVTLCLALFAGFVSAGSLNIGPTFALPDRARVLPMDGENVINGVPTRITVFSSPDTLESTAAWFRKTLTQPYTEDTRGGDIIFGKPAERHFSTIKLSAAPGGTRGVVAVADLEQGAKRSKITEARIKEWKSDLGVESKVLSFNESVTLGTEAQTLLMVNDRSPAGNIKAVHRLMEKRGFEFERELSDASKQVGSERGTTTLMFRAQAREAVVMVRPQAGGQTQLLINVTVQTKRG